MTSKLSVTELKKYLSASSQEELVNDILTFYKNYPDVKSYYQVKISGNDEQVFEKYKQIIEAEFLLGKRGQFPKLRYSVARKAISDFKKISSNQYDVIDLMVIYVESGVKCALEFGDIDEPFYNSVASMYKNAFETIIKQGYLRQFDNRLARIVHDTRRMGWGFHDELEHYYEKYTGEEWREHL